MTFAAAFKALRALLRVNQDGMAAKIGATQTTVSRYETGEREPSFAECRNIAKRIPGAKFLIDADGVHLLYQPKQQG